jgi:hypothetical protein
MHSLTENQLTRLRQAAESINLVLEELSAGSHEHSAPPSSGGGAVPEPKWVAEYRRTWRFLNELLERGGTATAQELSNIARRNGYDPRGIGGFYNGPSAALRRDGNQRELSDAGKRFVRQWAPEFGRR